MVATNFKINEHQLHPTTIYRARQKIFEYIIDTMKRPYNVRLSASLSGFIHDSGIITGHKVAPLIPNTTVPVWSLYQRSTLHQTTRSHPSHWQRKKGTPHKTGNRPAEPNVTVAHERCQDTPTIGTNIRERTCTTHHVTLGSMRVRSGENTFSSFQGSLLVSLRLQFD